MLFSLKRFPGSHVKGSFSHNNKLTSTLKSACAGRALSGILSMLTRSTQERFLKKLEWRKCR